MRVRGIGEIMTGECDVSRGTSSTNTSIKPGSPRWVASKYHQRRGTVEVTFNIGLILV